MTNNQQIVSSITEKYGINLHPYQRYAIDFIKTRHGCGLFFDMGLGKTLITLVALLEGNPQGHVLIIAPLAIARSTWLDEIKKWKLPFRTQSLIMNEKDKKLTRKKRLERYADVFNQPPTVFFINCELLTDLVENMPKEGGRKNGKPIWPFPFVIIDEMQSFKSNKSSRFKSLKQVRSQIHWLLGLTGTPAPNGLDDIWSQIYLMDEGARLGPNITRYHNEYFNPGLKINDVTVDWKPQYGAEQRIYARIADIVISQKNTVLQLPELTINDINIHMSDKELSRYKELAKNAVLTVGIDENGEDINITAKNAAVLHGKLLQMASGSIYVDEDHNYEVIHTHKLEHCKYIVENTDSPTLIAYHYKSEKDLLLKYLKDNGIQAFDGTRQMIQDWNDRKIPVMIVQPASAGHGINLQHGGHTLVWYSLPESLAEYMQLNARLYRQGQTQNCIIHRLITCKTLDEKVPKVLDKKEALQEELLDAVKFEVKELLTDDNN